MSPDFRHLENRIQNLTMRLDRIESMQEHLLRTTPSPAPVSAAEMLRREQRAQIIDDNDTILSLRASVRSLEAENRSLRTQLECARFREAVRRDPGKLDE